MKMLQQFKDAGVWFVKHITSPAIVFLMAPILGCLHLAYIIVSAILIHYILVQSGFMVDLGWNPLNVSNIRFTSMMLCGYFTTSLFYNYLITTEKKSSGEDFFIMALLLIVFPLTVFVGIRTRIDLSQFSASFILTQVFPGLLLMLTMPYFMLKGYLYMAHLIQEELSVS